MVNPVTPSEIMRKCIICGRNLRIELHESGEYTGDHFFRKVRIPVGDGENRSLAPHSLLSISTLGLHSPLPDARAGGNHGFFTGFHTFDDGDNDTT